MEQIIALSQQIESDPSKIILLEYHMLQYLKQHNSDQYHQDAGYSKTIPRFKTVGQTLPETLNRVQKYYWSLYRHTASVKKMMDSTRERMEKECDHVWERDWEDRDERSRYKCTFCNKGR